MRKRDFYHTGLDVSRSEVKNLLAGCGNPYGGQDYFVDGNAASPLGDGKSMDEALQSLSEAITLSNISIGLSANRWWARRNRIFACGDHELTENLTVFPEKCDIIGFGYDVEATPTLTGNHTIAAVATGLARSTRWFNFRFQNNNAGECFHFPTLSYAIEFHECVFEPLATGSTHAVRLADDNRGFKMIGCRVLQSVAGSPAAGIFAEAIKVEGNGQHDMVIRDNFIRATEGIHVLAGAANYNMIIDRNIIHSTAIGINDAAALAYVTNNNVITDADVDVAAGEQAITCNLAYANGNFITGTGTGCKNAPFPFQVVLTS